MKHGIFSFGLALWLLCVPAAFAATSTNPYQGEVPVASQAPADWQAAAPVALKQVLVNLTGNAQPEQVAALRRALAQATNYVQSYNYLTVAQPAAGQPNLMLQIRFAPKAIDQLVQQANQVTAVNTTSATGTTTPAASPAPAQQIVLQVRGVQGLDDYSALLNYLHGLTGVTAIDTKQMSDDLLVLAVAINIPPQELATALAGGGKLTSAADAPNPADGEVWRYQWVSAAPATQATAQTSTDTAPVATTAVAPASSAPAPPAPVAATQPAVTSDSSS